jgi:serralysin
MTTTISLSSVEAGIQITRDNYSWSSSMGVAAGPISFGFRASGPTYSGILNWSQDNAQEMAAAKAALGLWADVARITFTEANPGGYTDNATILFGNFNDPNSAGRAEAYTPKTQNLSFSSYQGDVWMNLAQDPYTNDGFGSVNFKTFLHEIGHALGLEHPGNYNATPGVTITYANNAEYIEDSRQYSVMSYFQASETGANHVYNGTTIYASTPLMDDISAIQRITART